MKRRACFPSFRIGGGAETTWHLPDASGEVRRMNLEDTSKGGETARKAVPFLMRLRGASFLRFHLTLHPNAAGATVAHLLPRG